jgi:hypothetical protein
MIWFKEIGMEGSKEVGMKRRVVAGVAALALMLASGSAARAETVAPLHWGETNSGDAAPDQEASPEREEGPTENRPLDKASPTLF